jgi:uncharacterized SAM-binding protein YcdF (DUF218 family)
LFLVVAAFAATAWTTASVHNQALLDEAAPADMIVVLGAAEYVGRPSPVLRSRLDHALSLYQKGLAPRILTTGGAGGDPVFTEGDVGRAYLLRRNVPAEAITVEQEGSTTAETAVVAAEIMVRMNLSSCIVVTDGYHIYRVKKMLEDRGFRVYGSPRKEEDRDGLRYWWLCARQAAAILMWKAGVVV